jgi:5-methylthioribose kinase
MIVSEASKLDLESYLKNQKLIEAQAKILKTEKPGEGNMNFTSRLILDNGNSLIIKQSREFVEKYPSIAAPKNRVVIEGEFYKLIQQNKALANYMPKVLHVDTQHNIILTEDLGNSKDLSFLYNGNDKISEDEIVSIAAYLSLLHSSFRECPRIEGFKNSEMKALNHEHIFVYPFMLENGFNLDQVCLGLQQASLIYKNDDLLKHKILEIGQMYLAEANVLLHGDYYFGSILRTANGLKVIDPEFCFYGFAEFDLGVLLAHFYLADQPISAIEKLKVCYQRANDFNENQLDSFVGVEILRRIIGLAQLPLSIDLKKRVELLEMAKQLILKN